MFVVGAIGCLFSVDNVEGTAVYRSSFCSLANILVISSSASSVKDFGGRELDEIEMRPPFGIPLDSSCGLQKADESCVAF